MSKITFSVIKADVGGWVGHSAIHPELIEEAKNRLEAAQIQDLILTSLPAATTWN
jgi:fructose 1,6-bisphosphate aldolase/phosphatase